MNHLESKLQLLLHKFAQMQTCEREMKKEMIKKDQEIAELKEIINQLRSELRGETGERHRLRFLEQQRIDYVKFLKKLLCKVQQLEEKVT